jgi:hypothetical protein
VRVAGLALGVVVLLAGLAQLVLPRIAASRIASRIARHGHVESVSVSAWPAVKLLWGEADSVRVRAGALALTSAQAAALLWEGRGAARIDISAAAVEVGPLALSDAVLRKRGESLEGEALTTQRQAVAALPPGIAVSLTGSDGGRVQVRVSGGLFGVGASVGAVAEASQGRLIVHPLGFPLEGLRMTLFSDPHVHVVAVGASVKSPDPLSYSLSMAAILR